MSPNIFENFLNVAVGGFVQSVVRDPDLTRLLVAAR